MPDNDFQDLKEAGMNVEGGLKYTLDKERFLAALQRFYRRSENNISAIRKKTALALKPATTQMTSNIS